VIGGDQKGFIKFLIRQRPDTLGNLSRPNRCAEVPNGKVSSLSGPDLTDKPTKSADFTFSVPQLKAMATAESTDELRSLSKMGPDALKQRAGDIAKRVGLSDTSPYGDRGMDGQNALLIDQLDRIAMSGQAKIADGAG
jgi:hypothetical protein